MTSKRLLGFLILAFLASLIYGYLQMPRQERVTAGSVNETQRQVVSKKDLPSKTTERVGYPRLRSDLMERKSQSYPGVRRDLFFSALTAEQNTEVIAVLPEEPPAVIVPPVVVQVASPPPPPSPQEVARQEISQYKFVGFYKKGEKKTIFLSSSGEVFLVRKGDYLGLNRKYYVLNITDTTLELRKEGTGDFSIKLTDQESLSAIPLLGQRKPEQAPSSFRPVQERDLPDQPVFLIVPDEESPTWEQIEPEEDKNEDKN